MTGFTESERPEVAHLYWAAFGPKLAVGLGSDGETVVADGLRADRVLVARETDRIVGICGFHAHGTGALDLTWSVLRRHLSPLRSVRAAAGLALIARGESRGTLVLDGICVDGSSRGQGIGTLLLDAATSHARARGDEAVELSVVDTNPRAARLYRRLGFTPVRSGSIGPLRHLYGFRRYDVLRRPVSP